LSSAANDPFVADELRSVPMPNFVGARLPAIGCEAVVKIVNSPLQESPSAFIAGKRAPTED
jgi:hypothetical protein